MKEEILDMYFNKQMKPIEIEKKLNIPKYTITRALQKDELIMGFVDWIRIDQD